MKQPLFRASSDTLALVRLLSKVEPGDLVTWNKMTDELGRDTRPDGAAYPAVLAARRILERDNRIAFEAEPTHGLRRLVNVEIVESGDRFVDRARRIVKRGVIRLTCADYAALPRDKQVQHNAKVSVLSAIAELGSAKSMRRIEHQIVDSDGALPAAKAAIAGLGDSVK
jgi:hypothetical protein